MFIDILFKGDLLSSEGLLMIIIFTQFPSISNEVFIWFQLSVILDRTEIY